MVREFCASRKGTKGKSSSKSGSSAYSSDSSVFSNKSNSLHWPNSLIHGGDIIDLDKNLEKNKYNKLKNIKHETLADVNFKCNSLDHMIYENKYREKI